MCKPAARLYDMHVCPAVEPGPIPHVGGPIIRASPNVFIDRRPAARLGDPGLCVGPGLEDPISSGSAAVLINGKKAARLGDSHSHGGKITTGSGGVLIGDTGDISVSPETKGTQDIYGKVLLGCGCPSETQDNAVSSAKSSGKPFCAVCNCKTKEEPEEEASEAAGGGGETVGADV